MDGSTVCMGGRRRMTLESVVAASITEGSEDAVGRRGWKRAP